MRTPSARCRNQVVTLFAYTWSTDVDAGPVIASTTTTAGLICSVDPGEPELVQDESGRWTQVVPYVFRFDDDPGCKAMDAIQWVDGARVHNITVAGVRPVSGRGGTFEVRGVERT